MFGRFAPLPLRLTGHKDGLSDAQHARICADMVAVTATMPFARVFFNTNGTGLVRCIGQHGFEAPTVTVIGTGIADVEWSAGYLDVDERAYAPRIRFAQARGVGNAGGFAVHVATCEILSFRKVRVCGFNSGGGSAVHGAVVLTVS